MITVRVHLEATGIVGVDNQYASDYFDTRINLTFEEAKEYYAKGKIINMGLWYDANENEHEDDLMRVTSCSIMPVL